MSVEVVRDFSKLQPYVAQWEELAAATLEPNIFYESWMLLPALEAFGDRDVRVVLVFSAAQAPGERLLCGVFPVDYDKRWKRLGIKVLNLWEYMHCYVGTPLVRAEYAFECLEAFFGWLAADPDGAALLNLPNLPGEGLFYRALVDHLGKHKLRSLVAWSVTRAVLYRLADTKTYLDAALSSKKRRKLRRQQEHLVEAGKIEYTALEPGGDADRWLREFLEIEAGGWKGREGTALRCDDANRKFFLDVAAAAHRRGRLMMIGMNLNGKPIAQLCNFHALPLSFAFKVAFDEKYARYSPGVLLEVENVRYVHETPGIETMYSCTDNPDSPVEFLWPDRHLIQNVVVATGKPPGELLLALMPLRWWLAKKLGGGMLRGRSK